MNLKNEPTINWPTGRMKVMKNHSAISQLPVPDAGFLGLLAVIACIGWNASGRLRAMGRGLNGDLLAERAGYATSPVT